MARTPSEVWAVRVEGLTVEDGPDGWVLVREPISVDRLEVESPTCRPAGVVLMAERGTRGPRSSF
jgi:hypothetical protein